MPSTSTRCASNARCTTASRSWSRAESPRRARALAEALQRWRGERALSDIEEDFAEPVRTRFGELRLVALERRIDCDLALGVTAELVGELEAIISAHPYREPAWRQLMLGALPIGPSGRRARRVQPGPGRAPRRARSRSRPRPRRARVGHPAPGPRPRRAAPHRVAVCARRHLGGRVWRPDGNAPGNDDPAVAVRRTRARARCV